MSKQRISHVSLLVVAGLMTTTSAQAAICVVPDSAGTAGLPPVGCEYETPNDDLFISNGLPAGTFIQIDSVLNSFFGIATAAGGSLGGEKENYMATLELDMEGHGTLTGYNRFIVMQVTNESHSAPRTPNTTPQSFATDMFTMQGQIFGDPDFDLLRITAGTNFGLPSPGHTTLTRLGPVGSNWNVDSFFDITYRIDFVGSPGSVLQGQSGSTVGTARFQLGNIPEPSSAVLIMLGLASFGARRNTLSY